MTDRPVKNPVHSVHQRLLNKAHQASRPFEEYFKLYAMERYLYRLSRSPHADKFILKGAFVFPAWKIAVARPTADIDLLGKIDNEVENVVRVFREICAEQVEPDGLVFAANRVLGGPIAEEAKYMGVRVRFPVFLGRSRVLMQIDVGFGDPVLSPITIDFPTLLDNPAPRLRGYSMESSIAEKFQAMVMRGRLNSRMKDFFDIWVLSERCEFKGKQISTAIQKVFRQRGTEVSGNTIALTEEFRGDPAKQAQWKAYLRRQQLTEAPQKFRDAAGRVADFIGPVATSLQKGKAFEGVWKPSGPWSPLKK